MEPKPPEPRAFEGHPVARRELELRGEVGVLQQHPHLAPVAGVDQARGVDERDPVLQRQARARQDQAGEALGNGDREARADADAAARRDARSLSRVEIQAGVGVVAAGGQRRLLAQPGEAELFHAADGSPGRGRRRPLGTPGIVPQRLQRVPGTIAAWVALSRDARRPLHRLVR